MTECGRASYASPGRASLFIGAVRVEALPCLGDSNYGVIVKSTLAELCPP
jgi:hypothetical protein